VVANNLQFLSLSVFISTHRDTVTIAYIRVTRQPFYCIWYRSPFVSNVQVHVTLCIHFLQKIKNFITRSDSPCVLIIPRMKGYRLFTDLITYYGILINWASCASTVIQIFFGWVIFVPYQTLLRLVSLIWIMYSLEVYLQIAVSIVTVIQWVKYGLST